MLEKNIEIKINEWLSDSYDQSTRAEIKKLVDDNNEKELVDRFYTDLEFGTGGIRGIIGAGTNRMNIYTVGKAAQGIANYVLKSDTSSRSKGIVIAYDSRNMSDVFSLRSALIFAANGIKSYVFKRLQATPLLSFAIRHLNTIAGVVVTASHNPPEYNGYKVYYSDGAQVLPPHDKGIIDEVRNIVSIKEIKEISEKEALDRGLLKYLDNEVNEAYYEKALSLRINTNILDEMKDELKIVYTPLHGTGNIPVRECLKRWGFNKVFVVKKQELPDANFSTVKYPNPEESEALSLAIKDAKENSCDLVLATDPDCDRVGIAVNNGKNEFILLNGNQVGVFLSHYIFKHYHKLNLLNKKSLVIKTIVSTDLIDPISKEFDVQVEEVLTGFKYIAERIHQYHDLENHSKEFLLGFEESYGYLVGDFVRDKDAVIASCFIAEIAAECKKKGKTILDYLDEIYERYGYYIEGLESLTLKGLEGIEKINGIMNAFRSNPPGDINSVKVVKIRDVKESKTIDLVSKKEEKLDFPKSNVLTYYLANGGKVTLRPSGTEPKIKFYFGFSIKDNKKNLQDVKMIGKQELDKLKESFMKLVKEKI
ncbi:MAG: phospho-sugar mutase [Spirochaetota bacterium]|nr:phospho-sugar mutase [Spirochaetota bacterium]